MTGTRATDPRYRLADFVRDLRAATAASDDVPELLERVAPLARRLALSRDWLEAAHYVCDTEQGFGIHVLHEEPDHRLLVFAAAWLPGRGPAPHDHGTWAVVAGVDGAETNISWERLDDGSRPGYANLRKREERIVEPGDVLTFLPGAIHSVVNHTREVTVSLHVYGFNINLTQRAQFDVEQGLERPITLRMTPAH